MQRRYVSPDRQDNVAVSAVSPSLRGSLRAGYRREMSRSARIIPLRTDAAMRLPDDDSGRRRHRALFGVAVAVGCLGATTPLPTEAQDGSVSLVVSVVVDQLRGDLLDHYADAWTGGFRRILDEGFVFTQASHAHARTSTAPGHATLSTGVFPSRHGLVANSWYQRKGFEWENVYAVGDPESPILGFESVEVLEGRSPSTLLRSGLPDWMAEADDDARQVIISRKDRAAVPMGGMDSEHVYWILPELGRFVTSTHYQRRYPQWLERFNEEKMPEIFGVDVWESGIPESFRDLARADTASYEFDGEHTHFPHMSQMENYPDTTWQQQNVWAAESPNADVAVHELALVALEELELGQRGSVDYLALAFSATDRVGHQFGPFSPEVFSTLLQLDRLLGELFESLDEVVGSGRWVFGISGDHGVVTMPEYARALGDENADRLLRTEVGGELNAALNASVPGGGGPEVMAQRLAENAVKVAVVEQAYTHRDLTRGPAPDSFAVFYRNSYYPGRAWDDLSRWGVDLRYGEGDYIGSPTGTNHETVYWYDRWVPMVFMGPGIMPGVSDAPVYTVDFAPTLAALAGIPVPDDLDGRRIY